MSPSLIALSSPELLQPDAENQSDLTTQTLRLPCRHASLGTPLEFALALVCFVLGIPVLVLAGVLIKLTSRGSIFYRQTRLGKDGKPFWFYKLRTMVSDSEKNGACWSMPGDPRVTPIGRLLRKTHLDELPQLWNVWKGEMCLIGPRPERPEFVAALNLSITHY
jgi:lipopolysaccharide/colanic/teichoic acid biosynthesis glycosyltransferase